MAKTKKINLKISGMHCAGCAMGIEKDLLKLDGVEKVLVNFATSTSSVEFLKKETDKKLIIDKISDLGFKAEINNSDDLDNKNEHVEAKNRFLLSLALTIPIAVISMKDMLSLALPFDKPTTGLILFFLTLPVFLFPGRTIFVDAFKQLKCWRANMNSLIALGSLSAFLFSVWITIESLILSSAISDFFYYETSAMIITLILLGRFLESRAKTKARDAIGALLRLRPEKAIAVINEEKIKIEVSAIKVGMILFVKPGDKVPADGMIIEGEPAVDESMITGESVPVEKQINDEVIGGSVNGNSSFKFKVNKTGEDTFLSGVVRLVSEAQNRKAPVQRLADKIAGIFVPVVILVSILTFGIWFLIDPQSSMLLTAPVAVLIIACPCALGLATPTAILTGTGWAARRGIFIRGGDILENVVNVDYVVFDKTGTLTEGNFEVVTIETISEKDEEEKVETKMIQLAASAESGSTHPLAKSIVDKAKQMEIELLPESDLTEFPGFGLQAKVKKNLVLVGNKATMEKENIDIKMLADKAGEEMEKGHTIVYVAVDNRVIGFLALSDKIRDEAPQVLNEISQTNRNVVILTGDNYLTAKGVAKTLTVGRFEAGVKPNQKAIIVETYRRAGYNVMMVGDGINDAPALASADIGVALGSGTDVAIESADIILVRDNLDSLTEAFKISSMTYRIIKQNLFWAFAYNIVAIPIASGLFYPVFGWSLSPVVAAATMAFSSIFVISNSLRLLKSE